MSTVSEILSYWDLHREGERIDLTFASIKKSKQKTRAKLKTDFPQLGKKCTHGDTACQMHLRKAGLGTLESRISKYSYMIGTDVCAEG